MFMHPDLLWSQSNQHRQDLVAEAETYRLLAAARRSRRSRAGRADHNGVARGRPAGILAASGPPAASPVG